MGAKYLQRQPITTEIKTYNDAGALNDPSTVTLKVLVPSGTATDYVYGTDSEVVKDATGIYTGTIDTSNEGGTYTYEWVTTGTPALAVQRRVEVEPSAFSA